MFMMETEMKKQIRFGVFETNSSSVNTLMIMSAKEYKDFMEKWDDPDWFWDRYEDRWVYYKDRLNEEYRYSVNPCETDYWNYYEKETATYTTEHGDEIVAVSIYGYNG